jgi:hypothetical protein
MDSMTLLCYLFLPLLNDVTDGECVFEFASAELESFQQNPKAELAVDLDGQMEL